MNSAMECINNYPPDVLFLKVIINNSWRENKENHNRGGGLDMWP